MRPSEFMEWNGKRTAVLIVAPMFVLFAVVLIRTAWVCDDAYITFRTVDNFVHGNGLRWNIAERVQSYTHPLWMFVLSAAHRLTGDLYHSSLLLSILLSLSAAAVLATRIAVSSRTALVGITILTFSKAFTDYSTSGLENPLSHVLLALFLMHYLAARPSPRALFTLSVLAACGALNRMDTVLLYLPVLGVVFYEVRSMKGFGALLLGFLPFLGWEFFSLVYYGFPFPNTYYAKLEAGIGRLDLLKQGLFYYRNSLTMDPLTLPSIGLGVLIPCIGRHWRQLAVVAGMGLYMGYVLWMGGDFMSGRYLAAPLLCAVALIARTPISGRAFVFALYVVVAVGFACPFPPPVAGADYGAERIMHMDRHGVSDERQFYYPTTGLLSPKRTGSTLTHMNAGVGLQLRKKGAVVERVRTVGFLGFFAGPEPHLVDQYALADPLLARLPARHDPRWRIGHFTRVIPEGYLETLSTGANVIEDENLAEYYEKLSLIVRGPLFSRGRWAAIVKMNLGLYDHLIDYSRYRYPEVEGRSTQPR